MKALIYLLALLFSVSSFSQLKDSIFSEMKKLPSNQEKLDYLGKTIVAQWLSNPENILNYANAYDSISKYNPTHLNKVNAANYKGMAYHVIEEYDRSINYYLEAIRLLESEKPGMTLSRVYNNLASSYRNRNDFNNTEKYYLKALELAEAVGDEPNWIATYNNNLSVLYMENKMYEKADQRIKNALTYYKGINDSITMAIIYLNYGNSKIYSEDFPKAISHYSQAMNLATIKQVPLIHAVAHTGIGIAYTKQKEYTNAIPQLLDGLKIAKQINHIEQMMESYTALAEYYSTTNNYKEAYSLALESQKIKDSINASDRDSNMAEALTKYEAEKKDAQLEVLNLQSEKSKQQQRLLSILALSGILIAGLVGFFLYKNKKKNTLLASQKELLENQKSLLEKTVGEKNILLKETHHRVKNSFQMVSSLLYLQSENVKDVEAKMAIKEAQNRVRSMVLIHHKLYNKDQLIGINAKEYIEDLTKDIFESHQDLSQNIAVQLDVENIVLSVDTITPIGLILNELIINVLKHAFNKNAADVLMKISFGRKEEVLILEVSDNGDGFEEGQGDDSFGLKLIRSLARKLEATLLINSELGKGTNTRLSIKEFEILS